MGGEPDRHQDRDRQPAADPPQPGHARRLPVRSPEDGYAYRFRQDARPLHAAEGAFLFCGYIVALALQQQGDTVAAARWFERNRAACGSPGLFSEEFDVEQRQLRGNLPQAFVHAIMLETSVRLAPALPHR